MPLYFAYGSNMNIDQMRERCPDSRYFGKAFLEDHQIAFTRYSSKWQSAVADILVKPGKIVWGILYNISIEDLQKLDRHEGHPGVYIRKQLVVNKIAADSFSIEDGAKINSDFEPLEAEVYEVVEKDLNLQPSLRYLVPILDAAFEHMLPFHYQKLLNEFGDHNYHEILSRTLDFFISLEDQIKNNEFPIKVNKQQEWGGANLVITGSQERKEGLNKYYPGDLVVLTKHWKELSWLVEKIYNDKTINWQIDAENKYHLLSEMGNAAVHHIEINKEEESPISICLAVLNAAYRVITSDFYRQY